MPEFGFNTTGIDVVNALPDHVKGKTCKSHSSLPSLS